MGGRRADAPSGFDSALLHKFAEGEFMVNGSRFIVHGQKKSVKT
jgi:hypothetical protein